MEGQPILHSCFVVVDSSKSFRVQYISNKVLKEFIFPIFHVFINGIFVFSIWYRNMNKEPYEWVYISILDHI